jgi:hypothetical protein
MPPRRDEHPTAPSTIARVIPLDDQWRERKLDSIPGGLAGRVSKLHSDMTPAKISLFVWMVIGCVYWITRVITKPAVSQYLTYWCFLLEMLVLLYMAAWEIAFAVDAARGSRTKLLYVRHRRSVVALVGVYTGISTMVFAGSIYISVDAAVTLAPDLAIDNTMALGNLITHTLPWVFAMIMICAYGEEVRKNLAHARWLVFWTTDKESAAIYPEMRDSYAAERYLRVVDYSTTAFDGLPHLRSTDPFRWWAVPWEDFVASKYPTVAAEARFLYTTSSHQLASAPAPQWIVRMAQTAFNEKILRDVLHFWGPLVVPAVWAAISDAEDTYEITATPALYLLTVCSLLGPSIILAVTARYNAVKDPINVTLFHRERQARTDSSLRSAPQRQ